VACAVILVSKAGPLQGLLAYAGAVLWALAGVVINQYDASLSPPARRYSLLHLWRWPSSARSAAEDDHASEPAGAWDLERPERAADRVFSLELVSPRATPVGRPCFIHELPRRCLLGNACAES
jgi:hypothetical protein